MGNNTLIFEIDKDKEDSRHLTVVESSAGGLRKASSSISGGFIWSLTKEGQDFWSYVSKRLEEMASAPVEEEDKDKEVKITIDGTKYIARPV